MVSAVTDALSSMIGWIGTFISNLVNAPVEGVGGALHSLLPLFAIGIAASVCFFAMKMLMDSQSHMGLVICLNIT